MFYRSKKEKDGHQARCIECTRAYQKLYYPDHKLEIKESQDKFYRLNPHKLVEYRARHNGKWAANNREKVEAEVAVADAIRRNLLEKPKVCCKCGENQKRVEYHHHLGYSFSNRLDVIPLCCVCHRAEHKAVKNNKNNLEIITPI